MVLGYAVLMLKASAVATAVVSLSGAAAYAVLGLACSYLGSPLACMMQEAVQAAAQWAWWAARSAWWLLAWASSALGPWATLAMAATLAALVWSARVGQCAR